MYKERDYAGWLKYYVKNGSAQQPLPLWIHEIINEPCAKIITAPMYFTRGFTFQTYAHCSRRLTANCGIHVPGENDFYGVLQEIIEVTYPGYYLDYTNYKKLQEIVSILISCVGFVTYAGVINLKCILFKCDWYDPTIGRGVRTNELGITDVNANRKFSKFEPFILASQAEQVCFLSYPRIRERREKWLSVIKINPRGRIVGDNEDVAIQRERSTEIPRATESTEDILHIDPTNMGVEDIVADLEDDEEIERDEFDEEESSGDSYVSENENE